MSRDGFMGPAIIRATPPLDQADHTELIQQLHQLKTLSDVVAWGAGQNPVAKTIGVVTQDEFTHDVIFLHEGLHLIFDTT